MAEKVPQNFSNHSRLDPPIHFFVLPVFAISLIITLVHLVMHPGLHSAWVVIFALAASVAVVKIRLYALKVQDRIIRLEERLRLAIVLDKPLRAHIGEFSESQLVALRFASDAELPALAEEPCQKSSPTRTLRKRSLSGDRTTGESETRGDSRPRLSQRAQCARCCFEFPMLKNC